MIAKVNHKLNKRSLWADRNDSYISINDISGNIDNIKGSLVLTRGNFSRCSIPPSEFEVILGN